MTTRHKHPQYRNENEGSRYPFADTASLRTGARTLPRELFIDAAIYPSRQDGAYYLRRISVDGLAVQFVIGSGTRDVGFGSYTPGDPDGTVALQDAQGRPAGVLLGNPSLLAAIHNWGPGDYSFTAASTQFVSSVVSPSPEAGVRSLAAEDAIPLTDDVWIVGEQGVVVSPAGSGRIRVDIVGEPLWRRLLCETTGQFEEVRYLQTINELPGDDWQMFRFAPGFAQSAAPALRIYVDATGTLVFNIAGGK